MNDLFQTPIEQAHDRWISAELCAACLRGSQGGLHIISHSVTALSRRDHRKDEDARTVSSIIMFRNRNRLLEFCQKRRIFPTGDERARTSRTNHGANGHPGRRKAHVRQEPASSREPCRGRPGSVAPRDKRSADARRSGHLSPAHGNPVRQPPAISRAGRRGARRATRRDHRLEWRRRCKCARSYHPSPGPAGLPDLRPQPEDEPRQAGGRISPRAAPGPGRSGPMPRCAP